MTTERDTTRLVRAWLREDDHESAARVVQVALEVVEQTPQRRGWRARRAPDWLVGPLGRALAPLTAVALVAVLVIVLFPFRGGQGTLPTTTPSPSPSPSGSAVPSPSGATTPGGGSRTPTQPPSLEPIGPSAAAFFPEDGPLPPGRTYFTRAGVSFSLDLPSDGWVSRQGFELAKGTLGQPGAIDMIFWDPSPTGFYADACAHSPLDRAATPPTGSRLDETAALVAAAPGSLATPPPRAEPVATTIGGRPARQITVPISDPLPCRDEMLWFAGDPASGRYPFAPGSTIRVWIVDVDGTLVWIDTETYRDAPSQVVDELQRVVSSIAFQ
jgi:hypothetical protein